MSVYLVASRQIVCLRPSLGHLICRLPPSRDHSDSRRLTLLQTPGQRSADETTQGYVIVCRCSAELHKRVVILPLPPTSRVGLSPAGVASPAAPCTTCPSRQDSFLAPLLSSQSQFLWGSKQEMFFMFFVLLYLFISSSCQNASFKKQSNLCFGLQFLYCCIIPSSSKTNIIWIAKLLI